jgi:hypothetical protein
MAKAKKESADNATDNLEVKSPIKEKKENNPFGKQPYQEWEVKIENGVVEKLKISRPLVKITEDQANILNTGVIEGSNTYAKMYFLPEN